MVGLTRVVADPLCPQGDPHRHEDLALQKLRQAAWRDLPTGGLAADPGAADDALGDPVCVRLQHHDVRRYPAHVSPLDELPARFRGVRVGPWPGEGPLPPQTWRSRGADKAEDGPRQRRQHGGQGAPVPRQHAGPQDRGGLVRPAALYQRDGLSGAGRRWTALLPGYRQLRPTRAVGSARGVRRVLQRRLPGQDPTVPNYGTSDWIDERNWRG